MKTFYYLILLTLFHLNTFIIFTQGNEVFTSNNINQELVNKLFLNHLNNHRLSLNLKPLKQNEKLNLAAKDHSEFMSVKNELTHFQLSDSKKEPYNRVVYYKGNFKSVGENITETPIKSAFTIKDKTLKIQTYEDLSFALYYAWKNSPPHYENMINPEFENSGIYVCLASTMDKLYTANVFGGKQYEAPVLFPSDYSLYNLKFDEQGKYKDLTNSTFAISTANFIYETHQLIDNYTNSDYAAMHYYDINEIKKIINKKTDGLMLDFVLREQFTCKSENILDNSPIYDGWPQEPIYNDEIYLKNKASKKNELDVNISMVPNKLYDQDYQTNVILLKDNTAINYTIPLSVPQNDFSVLNFKPLIDENDLKINDTTFIFHFTDKIYFNKGTSTPLEDSFFEESILNIDYLPKDSKLINIHAIGYSSIEGDSTKNEILQLNRVNYIKNYIIKNFNLNPSKIKTSTKSNIDDFYVDFGEILKLDKNLSLKQLNQFYLENKSKIDEEILATHRFTELKYDLALKLSPSSSINTLEFIYQHINELTTIEKTKVLKIILRKMQENEYIEFLDAKDFRNLLNKNLLLPLYFYSTDSIKFKEVYQQNKNSKNWTEKDRFNLVISNYKYYESYSKTFLPNLQLSANINLISKKTISDSLKNLLWLNYYLINTNINYENKNVVELKKSLEKFKEYYFKFEINIEDMLRIGMFFNKYSMFDWTFELLKDKLEKYPKNKDLWFIYLNTYTFAKYPNYENKELNYLLKNCIKLDKRLFCDWINLDDYQLLRNSIIKNNYCSICE